MQSSTHGPWCDEGKTERNLKTYLTTNRNGLFPYTPFSFSVHVCCSNTIYENLPFIQRLDFEICFIVYLFLENSLSCLE